MREFVDQTPDNRCGPTAAANPMPAPPDTLWPLEPHSRGKHHILRRYAQAWLPIMTRANPRVVLVDAFAGPGRYTGGEEGSPLILLKAFLEHHYRAHMAAEVVYLFIEEREDRVDHLRTEVAKLALPSNLRVEIRHGTYQATFGPLLGQLQEAGRHLAPTFCFVDPFGYSDAPMDLTGQFLQFQRCEVLIYMPLPWVARFLGRDGQEAALTSLFGTDGWRPAADLSWDQRLSFLHDLFRDQLRANGSTYVRSFEIQAGGPRGYHLFYGTTSLLGLEKMKEAMWSLDRLAGQRYGDSTQSNQLVLFEQQVDTAPLLRALKEHFGAREFSIEEARVHTLVETAYAASHLKTRTLAPAERRGELEATTPRPRSCTYPAQTRMRFVR
jgi:three-Cys-motif partner protein